MLVRSNTESFLLNFEKPLKKLANFSTSDEFSLSGNSLGPQQRSISGNFLLTSTFISRLLRAEFHSRTENETKINTKQGQSQKGIKWEDVTSSNC